MDPSTTPVFSMLSCGSEPSAASVGDGPKSPLAPVHALAVAADAASSAELPVASLGRELGRGRYRVVEGFFSEQRCFLVLSVHRAGTQTPIEGRRMEILEAVLGGLRQKNVAMDLSLAPSTVALNVTPAPVRVVSYSLVASYQSRSTPGWPSRALAPAASRHARIPC